MFFRIAAVSFLNTIPLVEYFSLSECSSVDLATDLPSRLPGYLTRGEADVALMPVIEFFRGIGGALVQGVGIATDGAVDSVKLFSLVEPGELDRVMVDRGSRTSVALLRVLLAEQFRTYPRFTEGIPVGLSDLEKYPAALVIGDRCFEFEKQLEEDGRTDVKIFDLGALWKNLTGLPFVFAAWTVASGFLESENREKRAELSNVLAKARDFGLDHLDDISKREAGLGKLGFRGDASSEAIDYYFRTSLLYKLGPRELEGMRRFRELCLKNDLLKDRRELILLDNEGNLHFESEKR